MGFRRGAEIFSFGEFEANVRTAELRKGGLRVSLQAKVFQLLISLLRKHGELVTREELRESLWSAGTYVDFDHNLNNAVAKLRAALGDPAEEHRYVETLGSRGYRFVAAVASDPKTFVRREPEMIRIAVLPFQDISETLLQRSVSQGLTEEITTCLGHHFPHRLGVIAPTTVLRYSGSSKTSARIGRELRVEYVLEGTVQIRDDLTHVTAHLIRVSDKTQVWASRYDCHLAEVFAVQSEVAERIAWSLGSELLEALPDRKAG